MHDSSSTQSSFLTDRIKSDCWWFTKNIWKMWQKLAVNHLFEELFLLIENIKLINNWDSWFLTVGDVSSSMHPRTLLRHSQSLWIKHGWQNILNYLLNIKLNSFSTFSYMCFNKTMTVDMFVCLIIQMNN